MMINATYQDIFQSPIGNILIGASQIGIKQLQFIETVPDNQSLIPNDITVSAQIWLEKYFNQENPDLDIPLDLEGSDFQRKVWHTLMDIPYGHKVSYKSISDKITGSSPRAVGNANGANPIMIYVPCHRIVGIDGQLTGYAGGIKRKSWLIAFEANDSLFLPDV